MWSIVCAVVCALLVVVGQSGCTQVRVDGLDDIDAPPRIARGPLPTYATVAERYNANLAPAAQISADSVGVVSWLEAGARRTEQVEGKLLFAAPPRSGDIARVQLSVRKLSQTLFMLGCDDQHFWWIDLTSDPHSATVGSHQTALMANASGAKAFALPLPTAEFVRAVGLVPLPADVPAGLQWSANGRLLGVTVPYSASGLARVSSLPASKQSTQRLWLDAQSLELRQVELFAPANQSQADQIGSPVIVTRVVSTQSASMPTMATTTPPRLPARVLIALTLADVDIDMSFGEMIAWPNTLPSVIESKPSNQPGLDARAFHWPYLRNQLSVLRVVDLDSPQPNAR